LAAALAIAVWAPWRQRQRGTPLSQFVIVPEKGFSLDRGTQQAISPDGRQLVFAGSSPGGTSSLWLRPLDSVTASPLVGTDDGTQPFWSPDSGSIAFFAHGKLEKMDLSGGPAQSLAEASFPLGGTWGRNGVIVFAPRVGHLYQVPAGGGEATPVTHSGFAQTFPCFLPDGRHFLFMDGSPRSGDRRIYVGSLDSQETKPVLQADWAIYAPPGYLLFLRESTLMTQRFDVAHLSTSDDPSAIAEHVGSFSVSGNGTLVYTPSLAGLTHLVWVDRAGRLISEAAPPGDYSNMQLSPDGKHVAFDGTESGKMDVWLRDLEHGIQSRLTIQGASNVAQWSPDGVSLVFASFNNGGIDLSERPSNMSAPEGVLLKLSAPPILFPSDWSSDGRYLAYYRTDSNSSIQLWILPMFGDRKPFPLVHAEFNESQGQFSPDGRWMAYVSDESGAPEIYVTSFPTPGGIRQISTAGGSQPRWRRDGKELFYVALDRNMMAVTVNTGGTFEADAPRALFETGLPPTPIRQGYSVSPDGQRFLLAVPVEAASPGMTLVQNWTALLKK
jgi:Tol biopolymer transport system component